MSVAYNATNKVVLIDHAKGRRDLLALNNASQFQPARYSIHHANDLNEEIAAQRVRSGSVAISCVSC